MGDMSRDREPSKLDLHRIQFHKFGRQASLLPLSVVSDDDMRPVVEEFKQKLFQFKKSLDSTENLSNEVYYKIYAEVLSEWGIMCPHPEEFRKYGISYDRSATKENSAHFNCSMCNCIVLNQDWIRNAKKEEKGDDDSGSEQGRVRGT